MSDEPATKKPRLAVEDPLCRRVLKEGWPLALFDRSTYVRRVVLQVFDGPLKNPFFDQQLEMLGHLDNCVSQCLREKVAFDMGRMIASYDRLAETFESMRAAHALVAMKPVLEDYAALTADINVSQKK